MTVRFFITPLQFHVLLTCILITTPLKGDLSPRLITLNAARVENSELDFLEINCSSSRQSIGNGAEFIVNGLTVGHITIHDNKCYNRKMEECIVDHCQCFPSDRLYIYKYKNNILTTELIIGCQMRFADNKTSSIIKAVMSRRFNGTVSDLYDYDVTILTQDKEKNKDNNENNSFVDNITLWLPLMCTVLLVIPAGVILFICLRRNCHNESRTNKRCISCKHRESMSSDEGEQLVLPEVIHRLSEEEKNRYFKFLLSSKEENRYFVRTMIVGKASSGKTCLLRRLLKDDLCDVYSTDGVDIHRCTINIENGKWIIGKDIDDDKVNRIKRAFTQTVEDKDNQDMQIDEININTDIHSPTCSDKEDSKTESLHKKEDLDEYSSLLPKYATTDKQINMDTNKEKKESSSLNMPKDLMSDLISNLTKDTPLNHALCELWDFAGQKEFYATHQAFLTSSAVYLVVADMTDDISKQGLSQCFSDFQHIGEYVDFWFDSIHCHRTADELSSNEHIDPPIILVFTGKDKYDKGDFKKREMELYSQLYQVLGSQSKYQHLRNIFFLSNLKDSDEVFEELQIAIYEAAQKMVHWGKPLPLKWILLEHLIEIAKNDGKKIINFTDLVFLAKHPDINILEEHELLSFLQFHHNAGTIIFFENIRDLIILRPQWLADAFRCLISDRFEHNRLRYLQDWTLLKRQGKISELLITELFHSKNFQFSGHKDCLHKVMEKLDIIVKIDSSYYIMPSMIPSSTFDVVCEKFGIFTGECKRTSWLCFKFAFVPPYFFNHLTASFIRKYQPCRLYSDTIALYRGICIFDLDESGCKKILVTMSTDTIALQVVSFSEQQAGFGSTCSDIYSEVKQYINDITARYKLEKSFVLHFKCSDGYYHKDTLEYETLKKCEEYYCVEHRQVHRSEQIYAPWMKNEVKTIPENEEDSFL